MFTHLHHIHTPTPNPPILPSPTTQERPSPHPAALSSPQALPCTRTRSPSFTPTPNAYAQVISHAIPSHRADARSLTHTSSLLLAHPPHAPRREPVFHILPRSFHSFDVVPFCFFPWAQPFCLTQGRAVALHCISPETCGIHRGRVRLRHGLDGSMHVLFLSWSEAATVSCPAGRSRGFAFLCHDVAGCVCVCVSWIGWVGRPCRWGKCVSGALLGF